MPKPHPLEILVQQGFSPIFTTSPESAETCNIRHPQKAIAKSTVKITRRENVSFHLHQILSRACEPAALN